MSHHKATNESNKQPRAASNGILMLLTLVVSLLILWQVQNLPVEAKKDKDKGKGGNMVVMMGHGGGGGYGGGGGGGGGYAMPMPYPIPMPMCPGGYGGGGGGGGGGSHGGGGREKGVREKIMIIPVPAQMLTHGDHPQGDGEGYGHSGGRSHAGGSEGFEESAGGGEHGASPRVPMLMLPISDAMTSYGGAGGSAEGYGSSMGGIGASAGGSSFNHGGGGMSGGGGYGAASQAYTLELAPMISNWNAMRGGGGDGREYAYGADQFASSSHQVAFVGPAPQGPQGTGNSPFGSMTDATEAASHQQEDSSVSKQAANSADRADLDYPTSDGLPAATALIPSQIAGPAAGSGYSKQLQDHLQYRPLAATFELSDDNNRHKKRRRRK